MSDMPPFVASLDLIDSAWGNQVVDAFPRLGIDGGFFPPTPTGTHRLMIYGGLIYTGTDASGDSTHEFPEAFESTPVVVVCPIDSGVERTLYVHDQTATGFKVRWRGSGGSVLAAGSPVGGQFAAIGYRA